VEDRAVFNQRYTRSIGATSTPAQERPVDRLVPPRPELTLVEGVERTNRQGLNVGVPEEGVVVLHRDPVRRDLLAHLPRVVEHVVSQSDEPERLPALDSLDGYDIPCPWFGLLRPGLLPLLEKLWVGWAHDLLVAICKKEEPIQQVVFERGPCYREGGREPTLLSQCEGRLEVTRKLFGAGSEVAVVCPRVRAWCGSYLVGPAAQRSKQVGRRCGESRVLGRQVREPHPASVARAGPGGFESGTSCVSNRVSNGPGQTGSALNAVGR
jgi:hypothetical protein